MIRVKFMPSIGGVFAYYDEAEKEAIRIARKIGAMKGLSVNEFTIHEEGKHRWSILPGKPAALENDGNWPTIVEFKQSDR